MFNHLMTAASLSSPGSGFPVKSVLCGGWSPWEHRPCCPTLALASCSSYCRDIPDTLGGPALLLATYVVRRCRVFGTLEVFHRFSCMFLVGL